MQKETNGYYLDIANIKWVDEQAKKDGRSASNYLDRLLTGLREGDKHAQN